MKKNCIECGKQFDTKPRKEEGWGLYCSKSCAGIVRERKKKVMKSITGKIR